MGKELSKYPCEGCPHYGTDDTGVFHRCYEGYNENKLSRCQRLNDKKVVALEAECNRLKEENDLLKENVEITNNFYDAALDKAKSVETRLAEAEKDLREIWIWVNERKDKVVSQRKIRLILYKYNFESPKKALRAEVEG